LIYNAVVKIGPYAFFFLLLAVFGSLGRQNGFAQFGRELSREGTGNWAKAGSLNNTFVRLPGYYAPGGIMSLKVRAYPLRAVCPQNDQQTIFIIVQDQTLAPVEGAQITLALNIPGKEEALYIVNPVTNEKGITTFSFPFTTDQVGLVQIRVRATRDRLEATTTTAFQIWW
jgi:hypothetical protein